MTRLQELEFRILVEFDRVCKELGLTYYLVCGSALGAAKYGGFIPWDDDIDVALPRKEYEIFLEKGPLLLPEWAFVQNYRTDCQFPLLGTKIRDSRTTYVERMCEKLPIHHGVFIDVFPLDEKWTTKKQYRKYLRMKRLFEARRRVHLSYNRFSRETVFSFRTNYYFIMNRLFGLYADTRKVLTKYEAFLSSFSADDQGVWCNHANSCSEIEFAPKAQYGKGILMRFEELEVLVPEQIDAYLIQKYGDWRSELPASEQFGHHHYYLCDLDKSYTEYFGDGERGLFI